MDFLAVLFLIILVRLEDITVRVGAYILNMLIKHYTIGKKYKKSFSLIFRTLLCDVSVSKPPTVYLKFQKCVLFYNRGKGFATFSAVKF
jgi:hypothetical protein